MSLSRFLQANKCSTFIHFVRKYSFNEQNIVLMHLKQREPLVSFSNNRKISSGDVMLSTNKKATNFDEDLREFDETYEIAKSAALHGIDKTMIEVVNWNATVLDYNTQDGKRLQGVTVLKSFKILTEDPSPNTLQACILGWCVEMFNGWVNASDDIMDQSAMRRGKPCWYNVPNVGFMAVNDSLLLESNVYKVLETCFKNTDAYSHFVEEFLQASRNTIYGQALDMLNAPPNKRPRFENFNMEKYKALLSHKTSSFFRLPVHLAMHLIGNFSENEFESLRNIWSKIAFLSQIENDYIDAFVDPSISGRSATDIINGKLTWFAVYVFENGTESMKKIMIENYGVDNEESVSKVMKLYNELCLREKFHESAQALMNEIYEMIYNLERKSFHKLFDSILLNVYKQRK